MAIVWLLKDIFVRFCYFVFFIACYFFLLYEYKDYIMLVYLKKYSVWGGTMFSIFDYNDLVESHFFLVSPILFTLALFHFFLFVVHFCITSCYRSELKKLIIGGILCVLGVVICLVISFEYGCVLYDYLNILFFPEEADSFQFSLDVSLVAYSRFLFSFFFFMVFFVFCLCILFIFKNRLNYYYTRIGALCVSLMFILFILPPDLGLHFYFLSIVLSLLEVCFVFFSFLSKNIGYFSG